MARSAIRMRLPGSNVDPYQRRFRLLSVAVGLSMGLLVAEIALRLMALPICKNPLPDLYQPAEDELLRFRMKPGFRGWAYGAWVETNLRGYRVHTRPNNRSGRPIVVVGDSIVFGFGLEQQQTLTERLRVHLERQLDGKAPVPEIVNMGVCGYNLEQELIAFRQDGATLHPSIVVLVLMSNDLDGVSGGAIFHSDLLASLRSTARANSHIASLLEYSWKKRKILHDGSLVYDLPLLRPHLQRALVVWNQQSWRRFQDSLAEFQRLVSSTSSDLHIAYYGEPNPFSARLRKYCDVHDLPFVPLQAAFESDWKHPRWQLEWDTHPSEIASDSMASFLALHLRLNAASFDGLAGITSDRSSQYQDQMRLWDTRVHFNERQEQTAVDHLPGAIGFNGQSVPYGILSGFDAYGTPIGPNPRIALRGSDSGFVMKGAAHSVAVLKISASPAWHPRTYYLSPGVFEITYPRETPSREIHDSRPATLEVHIQSGQVAIQQIVGRGDGVSHDLRVHSRSKPVGAIR